MRVRDGTFRIAACLAHCAVTTADDNLRAVTCVIPKPPEACWRSLVDATQMPAWVPGLRRARVVAVDGAGLPSEIQFDYAESRTYSLAYSYELADHVVRWEPRTGKRDGVRGFARLEAHAAGTRMTYALEHGVGRSPADRVLGDVEAILAAFCRWVCPQGAAVTSTV